jgi:hypothetical protein
MKINMAHLTQIERAMSERFRYRVEVDETSSNFKVTFFDPMAQESVSETLSAEDISRIAQDLTLIVEGLQ